MAAPSGHINYRPDIDGLRAVAVLSVVIFHAYPELAYSGFIGVDVFFVISGYLISSIIFGQLGRGTFSFAEFYGRRVKRIFPALLLVLASCWAFGWFALLAGEYRELGKHIAGGAGFVSNLVLWSEAGYFDKAAELKPLLHLWSLGIEEQFYIVWPFLAWLAWKSRRWMVVLLVLGIGSFAWSVVDVARGSIAAFYSPQTRFWELLAGGLLAWSSVAAKPWAPGIRLGRWLEASSTARSNAMGWAGLALIAGGLMRIGHGENFPGALAMIPVLGAVLLIGAGPVAWPNRAILSNRLAVWVGLISFPLYLWHWPLLSFARIIEGGNPSIHVRTAAVALALVLAWLTYRWIERPIRSGIQGRTPVLVLTASMAVVGLGGIYTMATQGITSREASRYVLTSQFGWNGDQRDRLCERVLGGGAEFCRLSSETSPTTVIIGDSIAWQLYFGLAHEAQDSGDTVLSYNQGGCAAFLGYSGRADYQQCQQVTRKALEIALQDSVKTVVLSSAPRPYVPGVRKVDIGVGPPGTGTLSSRSEFERVAKETFAGLLTELQARGKRVVYVKHNAPLSFDPEACVARRWAEPKKPRCVEPLQTYQESGRDYYPMIDEVLRRFPEVRVLELTSVLCDGRECTAMRDGKMLYRDFAHLSIDGSIAVGPALSRLMH